MKVLIVVSEKGGVTKTTTTALLAAEAARQGLDVTAIDLDPRATLTKLLRATEFRSGYSVDAILASDDPTGWADEVRVPSGWFDNLHVLPAERSLGNREKAPADHAEHRLAMSLKGLDTDLVIVDTPPRPGGLLVLSALAIQDAHVLYVGTPDQDGLDGVAEAWTTVDKAKTYTNPSLTTLGVAIGRVDNRLVDTKRCLKEFSNIYGDLVLQPYLPERVGVREARAANDWVGHYENGESVAEAAEELWKNVDARLDRAA